MNDNRLAIQRYAFSEEPYKLDERLQTLGYTEIWPSSEVELPDTSRRLILQKTRAMSVANPPIKKTTANLRLSRPEVLGWSSRKTVIHSAQLQTRRRKGQDLWSHIECLASNGHIFHGLSRHNESA